MKIASLFNLAGPDLFVILIIVLLLFGAKKWPNLIRGMGEAIREFARAWDEFLTKAAGDSERPKGEGGLAAVNRLLVPVAILIFLLACGVWVLGR